MKKTFTLIFGIALILQSNFVLAASTDPNLDPYTLGYTTSATMGTLQETPTQVELNNTKQAVQNYNNQQLSPQTGLASSCDRNPGGCNLTDLKGMAKSLVQVFMVPMSVVLFFAVALVLFILIKTRDSERPSVLIESRTKIMWMSIGFIGFVFITGGVVFSILRSFGVNPQYIDPVQNLTTFLGAQTVYAADLTNGSGNMLLPNPTNVTNLYDFLLVIFQVLIRWFIYPMIVLSWFYVGFSYVFARGNPEKLKATHKTLLYVLAATVIIMTLQAVLIALQNTIMNIFAK